MDQLTELIRQWTEQFGYVGIFLGMFIENIFPPLPSEIILGLAGFMVGQGELDLWLAVLSAVVGILLSAALFYALGYYGGRPLVLKFGRRFRISEEDLDYTEQWFKRYGTPLIIFGRFLPIIRTLVSIPAGLARMSFWRFMLLSAIPSVIWSFGFIYAGSVLGENWTVFSDSLKRAEYLALAVAVLIGLILLYLQREKLLKHFFPPKEDR